MSRLKAKGFKCPKCGCTRLRALHTDQKKDHMRRVRECNECGARVECQERIVGLIKRVKAV